MGAKGGFCPKKTNQMDGRKKNGKTNDKNEKKDTLIL